MARSKQSARLLLPPRPRPAPYPALARMTATIGPQQGHGYQRRYQPSPKKPKESEMDLGAEVRALELDISVNPLPESTGPRQPPAMTRYHGKAKLHKRPQEKRRHPKSWRKRKVPPTLTDPKAPLPQTSLVKDLPPLTNPGDTRLTTPKTPATQSQSEPQTQREVIDLTGED